MTLPGRCRCGAVNYTLTANGIPVSYACHCLECQTMSGGAFVVQLPVAASRLDVDGETTRWENTDSRGNRTTQHFCAVCKTRLFSTNSGRPGMALLRGGTLEDSQALTPALHIWVKRKQAWIGLPAGVEAFDEAAPVDFTRALFAANFSDP